MPFPSYFLSTYLLPSLFEGLFSCFFFVAIFWIFKSNLDQMKSSRNLLGLPRSLGVLTSAHTQWPREPQVVQGGPGRSGPGGPWGSPETIVHNCFALVHTRSIVSYCFPGFPGPPGVRSQKVPRKRRWEKVGEGGRKFEKVGENVKSVKR